MADDYSIRTMTVLNLVNPNRNRDLNISMNQLQKLLEDWIEEGYFYSKNGLVYFGVRSVAEFGESLRTKFNVDDCQLCKTVLLKVMTIQLWSLEVDENLYFQGIDCDGDTCNGRFHNNCLRKYMAKNPKCPKCKKAWTGPAP